MSTKKVTVLTKEERHEVYKMALELFDGGWPPPGLCTCIRWACLIWEPLNRLPIIFPELAHEKPDAAKEDDYWWPLTREGNAQRRAALLRMIAKTKPEQ